MHPTKHLVTISLIVLFSFLGAVSFSQAQEQDSSRISNLSSQLQSITSTLTDLLSSFARLGNAQVAAVTSSSGPADYYVSPNGNDSNSGTSLSNPWRTCSKAGSTARAGDVVQFRAGTYQTYNCNLNNSGTANNRIVFEAYPGEKPILEASHITPSYSNRWNMWSIVTINGNFITFRGFEVKDAPGTGIRVNGNDAVVANNTVHHTFLTGITVAQSYRTTVDNNHVYDAYDYANGPAPGTGGGGDADCINGGYHPGPTANHIITNNIVHDCSDDGIDLWTARGNVVTGNISYHNGYIPFTNTPAGNGGGYKLGGVSQQDGKIGGANTTRFNVAANNRNHGFNNNSGTNNILENNTSYNNSRNFAYFPSNATLRNNLCWSGNCDSGYTGSSNSWNMGIGNPLFISTDPNNANFLRLSSNSPAIDRGTNIGISYSGSAPDLGAYEYGGSTPPPTPPTCTSFTYSSWNSCQSNNTQSRTVISSSPNGCTGGTPVVTQSCTYTPTSSTYSLKKTAGVTIDGNTLEFANAPSITITNANNIATYKLLYDNNALYVAIDAQDTKLNYVPGGSQPWTYDSMEVYLRIGSQNYKFYDTAGGDLTTQASTGFTPLSGLTQQVQRNGTSNNNNDTDSGWSSEVRIPWSSLGLSGAPQAGTVYGLDISHNDSSGGSTFTQTAWRNTDGGGYNNYEGWGTFTVSSDVVGGGSTPPPTPPTCTSFTYSSWNSCQSNNTQSRTVISSSPNGCTGGTPVVTQSCTYTPTSSTYSLKKTAGVTIDGNTLEFANAPSITITNANNIATYKLLYDNNALYVAIDAQDTKLNYVPGGSQPWTYDSMEVYLRIGSQNYKFYDTAGGDLTTQASTGFTPLSGLTQQVQRNGTSNNNNDTDSGWSSEVRIPWSSLGLSGAPQAGTVYGLDISHNDSSGGSTFTQTAWRNTDGGGYNNYEGWGTFTVSSDVVGGGSTPPPTPPTCTSFTYSSWNSCQSNNTQSRTVISSSPNGCTGGTPVVTQSCTYTPPVSSGEADYWVSQSAGSDNNSCSQARNENTPKKTIAGGISCLSSGDTLVVKGGTYYEVNIGNAIPSGTLQNPTTIVSYNNDHVVIKTPNSTTPGILNSGATGASGLGGPDPIQRCFFFSGKSYITFDGINCDGNEFRGWDGMKSENGSHHLTFKNFYLRDFWNVGIKVNSSYSHEFLDCKIYRNGANDFRHGFYMDGDNHKIRNCDIYENGGWGIQIYGGASKNYVDIQNNRIWGNGTLIGPRGDGIYSDGSYGLFINNIVWDNAQAGITINGGIGNKILNNTIYDNAEKSGWNGLHITGSNNKAQNNIVYSDNIYNGGSGNTLSNNFTSNPQFISSSNKDFRLSSGSGAINAGTTLTEVTTDFVGIARPQGGAYDIGAYEYGGSTPPPTPPTCTSFTYSSWNSCQSNNTQSRTVISSSPNGCTGGTPVVTQSCTYTPPVSSGEATTRPRINASDLSYLGNFNVPGGKNGGRTAGFEYGGRTLSYNPYNNSLFMSGHVYDSYLAEISIPEIGGTATFLQTFEDPFGGKRDQVGVEANGNLIGGHLAYNNKLYLTAYLYYDAPKVAKASHFSRPLDLSASGVSDAAKIGNLNPAFYAGYMGNVPTEWQSILGGPAITGKCCIAIISRTSKGPSAFVFDPENLSAAHPLVYYDDAHPIPGNDYGDSGSHPIYNGTTKITGIAFPEGSRSVLFTGVTGTGNYCYGDPSQCGDPTDSSKGVHAYPYKAYMWAYDANELAEVRNGNKEPWEVLPYATWELPEIGNVLNIENISAGYDAINQKLYLSEAQGGSNSLPIVHVYKINLPNGTTPPPPTQPSNKFTLNDRISTTDVLNVRSSAGGTLLGVQSQGSTGTIVGGPVSSGGYTYWNINFDTGVDGWGAEDWLEKTVVVTPPLPTPQPPTSSTYSLKKTAGVTIDGNTLEFANAPSITITNANNIATYKLLYDNNALYVAIDAQDTKLNYVPGGSQPWTYDSMEVYLRIGSQNYKFYDTAGGDLTTQASTGFTPLSGLTQQVQRNGTSNNNNDTDSGWSSEVRIPWSSLGLSGAPQAGTVYGLDISHNDSSGGSTFTQTAWRNTDGGGYNNYEGWGTFTVSSDVVGGGSTPDPTPPQDAIPPVITNGQPTGSLSFGTTQTSLRVTTNENANCRYSTQANISFNTMANTMSGTSNHTAIVSGLSNGGTYSYFVKCRDTVGNTSSDAIITFSVQSPVNNQPVASNITFVTVEDQSKSLSLVGTDLDGDPLIYTVISTPVNGTLTGTPPNLTYTPQTGYTGNDSFKYTVSDGTLVSPSAMVTITVNQKPPVNIDDDGDGVVNQSDRCPKTPVNLRDHVNRHGCPRPIAENFDIKPDFEEDDLEAKTRDFEIGDTRFGKISFLQKLLKLTKQKDDYEGRLDLDSYISIGQNSITIDSINLPEFNQVATVSFYNVTHQNPYIKRDGIRCSACNKISYANGTLVYTVPGFSTYTVEEEGTNEEPDPTPPSSSGGGGGSSSGSGSSSGGGSSAPVVTSGSSGGGGGGGSFVPPASNNNPNAGNTAAAQSQQSTTQTIVVPRFTYTFTIVDWSVPGDSSQSVQKLQEALTLLGYETPQTGTFDDITTKSLQSFQNDNNIVSSGSPLTTGFGALGPSTRNALNQKTSVLTITKTVPLAPTTNSFSGTVNSSSYRFTRSLTLGDTGEDVRQLQIFLNNNGFIVASSGVGSKGNETTYFGGLTAQAVIKFQEKYASEILTPVGLTNGSGYFGQSSIAKAHTLGTTSNDDTQRMALLAQLTSLIELVAQLQAQLAVLKGE